ncbi:MAG: hypothetical protein ACRCR6_01400 [Plesiomonas sp.]
MSYKNKLRITKLKLELRNNVIKINKNEKTELILSLKNNIDISEVDLWYEYYINIKRLLFKSNSYEDSMRSSLYENMKKIKNDIKQLIYDIDSLSSNIPESSIIIIVPQLLSINHSPTYITTSVIQELISLGFNPILINTNAVAIEDNLSLTKWNTLQHPEKNYTLSLLNGTILIEHNYDEGEFIAINNKKVRYINLTGSIIDKAREFNKINNFIIKNKIPTLSIGDDFIPDTTSQVYPGYYLPLSIDHHGTDTTKYFVFRNKEHYTDKEIKIEFPYYRSPPRSYLPSENTDTFNICVVGNRLDVEIDDFFADCLNYLITKIEKIKIFILGCRHHHKIADDKVIFTEYDCDLQRFYKENNIAAYLNPKRKGGGYSAFYALELGIPVISPPYGDVDYITDSMFTYSSKKSLLETINIIRPATNTAALIQRLTTRVDELVDHSDFIQHVINCHHE